MNGAAWPNHSLSYQQTGCTRFNGTFDTLHYIPPQNDTHFGCYSFDINHPIYHSVLWRCWLGIRKGIRPVKNWVVGCWCGYLSGARCRLAYGPAHATHCLLLQENPDRFYLSGTGSLGVRVVPEKGLLSACVCVNHPILLIFGKNTAERVSYQMAF